MRLEKLFIFFAILLFCGCSASNNFYFYCKQGSPSAEAKQTIKVFLKVAETEDCAVAYERLIRKFHIDINNKGVTDITPLAGLKKIEKLNISHNKIRKILPLKGLLQRLGYLNIGSNPIEDYDSLHFLLNLTILYIYDSNLDSLIPIQNAKKMELLWVTNTNVSDLTPIENFLELRDLRLFDNKIVNIEPLRTLPSLAWLYLNNNQIEDVSYLKENLYLEKIDLGNNKIKDVSPLADVKGLSLLKLEGNPIIKDKKHCPYGKKVPKLLSLFCKKYLSKK